MSRWTPDHSAFLSLLLDVVVGTKEMMELRRDRCMLVDNIKSNTQVSTVVHFTGSKSEALDLPGSDTDLMFEINDMYTIKVIQSLQENYMTYPNIVFYMCTENCPPGFALLRYIKPGIDPLSFALTNVIQTIDGLQYLSSDLVVDRIAFSAIKTNIESKRARQGPSMEAWTIFENTEESGTDYVLSIHCSFWPNNALDGSNAHDILDGLNHMTFHQL